MFRGDRLTTDDRESQEGVLERVKDGGEPRVIWKVDMYMVIEERGGIFNPSPDHIVNNSISEPKVMIKATAIYDRFHLSFDRHLPYAPITIQNIHISSILSPPFSSRSLDPFVIPTSYRK